MNRALASVQQVERIEAIEGARRIEVAVVLGWRVVVSKGQLKPGDKVVYFEVDTLLPEDNPAFSALQNHGQKTIAIGGREVRGHVLRTMKLRGQVSQGLVMPLSELGLHEGEVAVGENLTQRLGVYKYKEPTPVASNIIGRFDTRFCPKTDSTRLQSLAKRWEAIKQMRWLPTVKVDGTSRTIVLSEEGVRIFSRNWEIDASDAGLQVAKDWGIVDSLTPGMAVQFELAGPGIQGNRLKLSKQRPFVFALWLNNDKVPYANWPRPLKEASVRVLDEAEFAPRGELLGFVDFVSEKLKHSAEGGLPDEGVVYHLVDNCGLELPRRIEGLKNFKVINSNYLLKHKI